MLTNVHRRCHFLVVHSGSILNQQGGDAIYQSFRSQSLVFRHTTLRYGLPCTLRQERKASGERIGKRLDQEPPEKKRSM
jgi:hypothetical protein